MDLIQIETDTSNELRRSVTSIQMIALSIGGTIGGGIFVLSGEAAAQNAGPSIVISFIIGGIIALLTALSMSEMSSMMSSSGSVYTYTYVAMGEYPAFIIGWLSTFLYQLGALTIAVRWSHYVVHLIDLVSDFNVTSTLVDAPLFWSKKSNQMSVTGSAINLPAIAIIMAICFVLIIGIRETAIVNLVFVIIKLIILIIFIIAGSIYVNRANYTPFFPPNIGSFREYGVTGMLYGSTFVFYAYVGFESATAVAQEADTPSQSMPLALIVSLVITLLIYVGVSTVLVGLVSYRVLSTTYPLATALQGTPLQSWLPILLSLGAIAALTTVAIVILLAQSRVFYAMARDGLLPSIFARVHHRTLTPWVSIVICCAICAFMAGICPIDILGELTSIGALITYIFVHICVIVLRFTHGHMPRAFRVPFGPWLIPVLGILLCLLLISSVTEGTGIRFGIWMAIGHIVYFSYGFRYAKIRQQPRGDSFASVNEIVPEVNYVASAPMEIEIGNEIIEEETHM